MTDNPYVSRGGLKLKAAIDTFGLTLDGLTCADLGCNVGGFTDCLLQHGAAKVYAVDTGYGTLDWKLRNDPKVVVMERTNALHTEPAEPCDLVTIDLAWTRQARAIPAALPWLKPAGRIITLIKPHYEADPRKLAQGVLPVELAEAVTNQVLDQMPGLGVMVIASMRSPIVGGGKRKGGGNTEYLALLQLAAKK